ncbi:MAG: cation-translocating P-type ATPase [Planctomycetia bacterium]|nr:cation-translocating P-type ATPase [Planctomycetia bacterium]
MQLNYKDLQLDPSRGLDNSQIDQMRDLFGKNMLTPPPKTPWWKELLDKFKDPTIQILLAAAAISLIITAVEKYALHDADANFIDSIGIFLAVLLATLVGYFSERKSAREFDLLNRVKDDITIKVQRNGKITEVHIEDIVVGDLVHLQPGDKVPSDGLLLESRSLYIDQAMLTGESVPARKGIFALAKESESANFQDLIDAAGPQHDAFVARGTMVADGHGLFITTAVGDKTEMGKIAQALVQDDDQNNETPLVAKLARLAKQISVLGTIGATSIFTLMSVIAACQSPLSRQILKESGELSGIILCALFLGILLTKFAALPFFKSMDMEVKKFRLRVLLSIPMIIAAFTILLGIWGMVFQDAEQQIGMDLLHNILLAFVVAVTIIVVAVPEGLPMMVTVSLALNMMKMARENCLVRKLVASETIGSATIICTDKTGTLTQNQMKPVWFWSGENEYHPDQFSSLVQTGIWEHLVRGITINSSANLEIVKEDEKESIRGIGNPTECSLLKFLQAQGVDYLAERKRGQSLFELGHNSERKMSAVFARISDRTTCFLKGAPERILARCSSILIDGKEEPIDPYREKISEAIKSASDQALRVLAFSEKTCSGECEGCRGKDPAACLACGDHCFVSLTGIADPVREEVPAAVQTCLDAGVQVKIITGDALPTAKAIAKKVHVYNGSEEELVLDSAAFNAVSDEDLPEKAEHLKVLARSTPMDKLRLVKALHKRGEVVAMTGDGTNDAPALKYADVGLSMGITGTEVAKEASDIVLLDDNFKSIVTGIWWGRTLFQNIQRFLQFQLSVNIVALLCALIGPLVGVPLPFTVTQLLWINIIMDTFAAIALSTDPPRPRTMKEKPIPKDAHIITKTMGITMVVVSLYQVAVLFAVLFCGWFVAPEHQYDGSISMTDSKYMEHNLEALTVFFTVLVMFQFWHKINCRSLHYDESPWNMITKNRLFIAIISIITITQIIMVQSHTVGQFFRTTPLDWEQWLKIFLLTATVLPVAWIGRQIARLAHER